MLYNKKGFYNKLHMSCCCNNCLFAGNSQLYTTPECYAYSLSRKDTPFSAARSESSDKDPYPFSGANRYMV